MKVLSLLSESTKLVVLLIGVFDKVSAESFDFLVAYVARRSEQGGSDYEDLRIQMNISFTL